MRRDRIHRDVGLNRHAMWPKAKGMGEASGPQEYDESAWWWWIGSGRSRGYERETDLSACLGVCSSRAKLLHVLNLLPQATLV